MREAGEPGTGIPMLTRMCPPHRGWSWSHRPRFRATLGSWSKAKGRAWEDGEHHGAANNRSIIKARAPKDLGHRNASHKELHYEVNHHDYHQRGYYPANGSTRHLSTSSACCVGPASRIA